MSTLVDQARRTHCPKCGTNHPNPSCKYMVPTDFDEVRHQLNNDLCDFSDRWELDGDYMRCRKCRRPQIASAEGHPYIHGERCKASTGVDQYPWRMLRDLIARMYPPSSVQPEKEERRPLSDEQIDALWSDVPRSRILTNARSPWLWELIVGLVRKVEAAHGIGGGNG